MKDNQILQAIDDLKSGKMIIIADDVNRENEGDIVMAAEKVTEASIAFMLKKASGLVCLAITSNIANKLNLPLMVGNNQESMKTAFTVSIDAKNGITTGISAADRVKTILDVVHSCADDLVRPGHIFPVIAKDGGVRERRGHTEASVEMMKLANLIPAAVICEILDDDGRTIHGKNLEIYANHHNMQLVHIKDLIEFLGNK